MSAPEEFGPTPPKANKPSLRDSSVAPASPAPKRITRRGLFKRAMTYIVAPAVVGAYSTQIEPFWIRYPEFQIPIPGLPKAFDNYRIAQLSDMHAGKVSIDFLASVIAKVKRLKPDAVAVTGDLIHHMNEAIDPICDLLGTFDVPVIVSFGNHDYGVYRETEGPGDPELDDKLEAALTKRGCHILRNRAMPIDRAGSRLWFVGMEDLWFGNYSPPTAFAGVPENETVIALSHNPDTAERVDVHRPSLILAGHTHGGQIRLPLFGTIHLNTATKIYDWGLFQLMHSKLYVSSGVGYIRRIRFLCRPEAPLFQLTCA